MSASGQSWREALAEMENPELDPGERHRLANVVRDEVEELERGLLAGAQKGAEVLRKVLAPPGLRERSVVAWRRGTSFSIKVDGPEDAQWLEEVISDPPSAFRVRPSEAGAKALAQDAPKTWGRGIRATMSCVRVDAGAFEEEPGEALSAALRAVDQQPGDWIIIGPRRRNVGGHSGRSLTLTFGFISMDEVHEQGGKDDGE